MRATSCSSASWKRRWLERPVISSTVACRRSCSLQLDVLDRQRGLLRQVGEQRLLLLRERARAARDHEHLGAGRAAAAGQRMRHRDLLAGRGHAQGPAALRGAARPPTATASDPPPMLDRARGEVGPPELGAERLDRGPQADVHRAPRGRAASRTPRRSGGSRGRAARARSSAGRAGRPPRGCGSAGRSRARPAARAAAARARTRRGARPRRSRSGSRPGSGRRRSRRR